MVHNNGKEIGELVGLYLLDYLKIYGDEGLFVVNNYPNADLERVCKKLRRSIKDIGCNTILLQLLQ